MWLMVHMHPNMWPMGSSHYSFPSFSYPIWPAMGLYWAAWNFIWMSWTRPSLIAPPIHQTLANLHPKWGGANCSLSQCILPLYLFYLFISVNIPICTLKIHPQCLYQSSGVNQVALSQALNAVWIYHGPVYTPFAFLSEHCWCPPDWEKVLEVTCTTTTTTTYEGTYF